MNRKVFKLVTKDGKIMVTEYRIVDSKNQSTKVILNKNYKRTKARWPSLSDSGRLLFEKPDWRMAMPGNIGLTQNQQKDNPTDKTSFEEALDQLEIESPDEFQQMKMQIRKEMAKQRYLTTLEELKKRGLEQKDASEASYNLLNNWLIPTDPNARDKNTTTVIDRHTGKIVKVPVLPLIPETTVDELVNYKTKNNEKVEFSAHKLPQLLKKDLETIFPNTNKDFQDVLPEKFSRINVFLNNIENVNSAKNMGESGIFPKASTKYNILDQNRKNYTFPTTVFHRALTLPNDINFKSFNTVITICFQTNHNMSSYSNEALDEKKEIHDKFLELAKKLSYILLEENFYVDFVDPTTGLPFFDNFSAQANKEEILKLTTQENNENFSLLENIKIEDAGCCKMISHDKYGENCFMGLIVSNCGNDHWLVESLK